MKIQAIGPRPIGVDFFVEDTGATPGARPTRPPPQVLGAVGALAGLAPRRRQAQGQSMAPRKPLDDVQGHLQGQTQGTGQGGGTRLLRPRLGGQRSAPTRCAPQRRRLAAHHHEPDHHDTPHPQLKLGVRGGLVRGQPDPGRAGRSGSPAWVRPSRRNPASCRWTRPATPTRHALTARASGGAMPWPPCSGCLARRCKTRCWPTRSGMTRPPRRRSSSASSNKAHRSGPRPPSTRSSAEAFLFQAQADLPARLKAAGSTLAHQAYDSLMGQVAQLQHARPELRHIPAEDLAAAAGLHRQPPRPGAERAAGRAGARPTRWGCRLPRPWVSALHALPPAYTHQGPAFTPAGRHRGHAAAAAQSPARHASSGRSSARPQAREAGHAAMQTPGAERQEHRSLRAAPARPGIGVPARHGLPGRSHDLRTRAHGDAVGAAAPAAGPSTEPFARPADPSLMASQRAAAPAA